MPRNIANVAVPTDLNCRTVIKYAVELLTVKFIVCGYCGGILKDFNVRATGMVILQIQRLIELTISAS